MTEPIAETIKNIVADLFSCSRMELNESSGPGDVPRWDSLGHIQLLEAVSDRFKVAIPIETALEAQSIGDLARIIAKARSEKG
ncbi:MAG: acyl carrier protein [Gammaproteobacteria bacterium]|nr:acyl carrier protein [Gammaproteobacteria bacterium]